MQEKITRLCLKVKLEHSCISCFSSRHRWNRHVIYEAFQVKITPLKIKPLSAIIRMATE